MLECSSELTLLDVTVPVPVVITTVVATLETPDICVVAMTMDVVACVLLTSVAAVVELV